MHKLHSTCIFFFAFFFNDRGGVRCWWGWGSKVLVGVGEVQAKQNSKIIFNFFKPS